MRVALQQGSAPAPVEASHGAHHGKQESKEHQKELAVIRQQYLGTQKTKRRVAKASDKFRSALMSRFHCWPQALSCSARPAMIPALDPFIKQACMLACSMRRC